MKKIILAVSFLLMTGCSHISRTTADLGDQKEFGVINMGEKILYIVDPRTESCLLLYVGAAAASVDCQKLKKNVPESAEYISWEGS